ncbi:SDR family NAD(P)-dependent oxidoreductase [Streptomyces sp. AA1529]|uniref:SDR family NAD(P)-dependent oxidoreductase n=1 Tax=Streptomyces sp. AA1529 TaxID=1203257 RepID=UPI003D74CEC4
MIGRTSPRSVRAGRHAGRPSPSGRAFRPAGGRPRAHERCGSAAHRGQALVVQIHQVAAALVVDPRLVQADIRSLPDIDRAAEQARRRFGSLDLLFLNADVSRPGPVESTDEDTFDTLFDVNAKDTFLTLQKALPLLEEGASVVITVGAGEGLGAATTAAKGALLPPVRSLALELAPRRIRVNAVSPGLIDTPAHSRMGISPEMLDSWARDIPLGRVGTPSDVAETVAFLASDAAGYLTVSGGVGVHDRP